MDKWYAAQKFFDLLEEESMKINNEEIEASAEYADAINVAKHSILTLLKYW